MATSTLPSDIPTSTQAHLITGKVEIYNSSGSLTGYEYHYYFIPFFIWIIIGVVILFVMSRITIEFIKRWNKHL